MKTFSKTPSETSSRNINCVLCGGSRLSPVWKDSELPFVRCSDCGLVFQNPQPVAHELAERYDEEYFDYEIENEENFYRLMVLGLQDVRFFEQEKRIFSRYESASAAPAFLDVGCATGCLLADMKGRGWDVKGVELCKASADYGTSRRGLDIHAGTMETAGFADSSFDAVHCSHLIEHLTDPDAFVAETARILKPGGVFIAVTPDISGFQARLFGAGWRSAIADHMFLFSKRTLSAMMRKHGFKIMRSASWGGLAAGSAPRFLKKAADSLVKPLGSGDVICIMGTF